MDKGQEHHIEFLEAGEDAPEALEATEESFNLVAPTIHRPIVLRACPNFCVNGFSDYN